MKRRVSRRRRGVEGEEEERLGDGEGSRSRGAEQVGWERFDGLLPDVVEETSGP